MSDVPALAVTTDGKEILKKLPFTGVRRTMAQNLSDSWHTCVSTTSFNRVDMSAVIKLRADLAAQGKKVSYTDIFTRLTAYAIGEHPMVNCSIHERKLEVYKSVNVGVAVSTPDGYVVVPVIRNAQEKSLLQISDELKMLVEKARSKTLTPEDFAGGTVTISNLGMYEICAFVQVLVQPQSFILGFGGIKQEPVVLDVGTIAARPMMYISDTTDHRAIHGETLMQFYKTYLAAFREPEKYMEP